MNGRWDDKANLKFISLYEQNQCLWKTDSHVYKNRDAREMAINRVVEAMGIPDFRNLDCKNKIKNVRSHYIQELKKIRKSTSRSPVGEPTYEPKLAWFKPLDRFLRPHILTLTKAGGANERHPPRTRGVVAEEMAQDATTAMWLDSPPQDTNEVRAVVDAPPRPATTPSPRYVFVEMEEGAAEPEDRKSSKRRALGGGGEAPAPVPAPVATSQGPDLFVEAQSVNVTPGQRDIEFEAFGRSIAAQLMNMPFSVALQLQLKIQTLITEERLRMLRSPPD